MASLKEKLQESIREFDKALQDTGLRPIRPLTRSHFISCERCGVDIELEGPNLKPFLHYDLESLCDGCRESESR